jgi:cell division protein FtsL
MREQNLLPHKLRFKSSSIIQMIQMILGEIPSLYNTNQDFLSLSAYDRSILLHNTVAHVTSLSTNFTLYKIGLTEQPTYDDAVAIMGDPDLVPIVKRIEGRLNFDMTTMKLFLTILSFSTASYTVYSNMPSRNLLNIKQILKIQDKYIELTWRYLLYKNDFQRTVRIFSDLIRSIFIIYETIVKVHDIQWYINTFDAIIQQTEQSLSTDG